MLRISPVWVVCALEDDEFSEFEKKLKRQFKAISTNEMERFDESTHKWWKITNVSPANETLTDDIDQQGHPCDVPAFDAPTGLFDLYKLMVIYYGKNDEFASLFPIAQGLKKLQDAGQFMNGGQIIPYGLCVVANGSELPNDLKQNINELIKPENINTSIQKIFFQGDQNKNAGNRAGYDSLLDDKTPDYPRHHIHDLSVQIISHLSLVKDNIANRTTTGDRILTAGVSRRRPVKSNQLRRAGRFRTYLPERRQSSLHRTCYRRFPEHALLVRQRKPCPERMADIRRIRARLSDPARRPRMACRTGDTPRHLLCQRLVTGLRKISLLVGDRRRSAPCLPGTLCRSLPRLAELL